MKCQSVLFPSSLLLFLSLTVIIPSEGLETILSRCCNLGVQWGWENRTCNEFPAPVHAVTVEHQAPCLSTIDACCRRNYRERQCILGQATAKAGRECVAGAGSAGQYHQDCCEGCKLGLIAGAMGLACEFQALKLALGPPWDSSLTRCCLQAGGTQTPPQSQPQPQSPTRFNTQYRHPSTPLSSTYRPNPSSSHGTGIGTGTGNLGQHEPLQDFCTLFPGQLCSQICISDGRNSYRCECRAGFVLLADAKTCREETQDERNNRSTQTSRHGSSTQSQCPAGFVYNVNTQVCDDVNECLLSEGAKACFPYKKCVNTIGSFLCEEIEPTNENSSADCPPGYRKKNGTEECVDIDECAEGYDICVREIQYCINTPGGFDCKNKKEFKRYDCPAGYKFNNVTLNCEDVDECAENLDSCDQNSEVCRNTAGAYECDVQCSSGYRYDTRIRACQDVDECKEGTHDCRVEKERCVNVQGTYQCHQLSTTSSKCPPGYEPNRNYTFLCQDRDECATGLHTCAASETCINEVGGYRCEGNADNTQTTPAYDSNDLDDSDSEEISTTASPTTNNAVESINQIFERNRNSRNNNNNENPDPRSNQVEKQNTCSTGYRLRGPSRSGEAPLCDDINECTESNPCDSTQLCQNTLGSFYCHCKSGYYRDPITRACLDVNECQTGQHNCATSQRCDNTPGSFSCIRITGCGTGYTLNAASGQCEDDDECVFGNHDCDTLGPEWQCKNTPGSFRCEKAARTCGTGLSLAPNGECRPNCSTGFLFNHRGDCVDIDECKPLPGSRSPCSSNQQCVNTQGSYQCMSKIICPVGFEPDPTSGTKCADINECERGTHTCRGNQICVNRGGGYSCQCPNGYEIRDGTCVDIDECTKYSSQICASNSECVNSQGSFRCVCKEGFVQASDNRTCSDIDECLTITGLCEQNCINTWGSYKCSCGAGYTISPDGRTCRDVDECAQVAEGSLCVGNCVNTQGSYKCDCPSGYKLGPDGRTCLDIDECQQSRVCRSDETCLNIRGGYRCNRIQCPAGYAKDGDNTERCKKVEQCAERDLQCLKQPLTISRNFLSFTSNIRIPTAGYVDMFTMRGPTWPGAVMHFNLEIKNSRAGQAGVSVASRQHFLLRRPTPYQAVVALSRPLSGPQDIELELTMEVYHRGAYAGSAVAQILIVVTTYEF